MLGGTACGYGLYILMGWETMDLVGLITTTIEAAAALLVLSPAVAGSASSARQHGAAFAAVPVALVALLGTNVLAGATTATTTATAAPAHSAAAPASASRSMKGMTLAHDAALSLPTQSPAGNIVWPDDMATMGAGMKMAEPNCTAQPTTAQQHAAVRLVNRTVASARKYTSLTAAQAAGYVPVTPSGARIVHYINPAFYRSGGVLDPNEIPSLVYVNTAHGAVLAAAMYLVPRGTTPPQPGGCLTQWHIHTDLCFSSGKVVGTDNNGSCAGDSTNQVTQPMMHVWMTPVSGGPLTPDPPARSEVEAAARLPVLSPQNGTA
jgi:hypothetical protein